MSNLFKDILRDKGSVKYSITKFLAIVFSTLLFGYLIMYLFIFRQEVDHAIVGELMALIAGLVGFKNGWGVRNKTEEINKFSSDKKIEPKPNDVKMDDTVF